MRSLKLSMVVTSFLGVTRSHQIWTSNLFQDQKRVWKMGLCFSSVLTASSLSLSLDNWVMYAGSTLLMDTGRETSEFTYFVSLYPAHYYRICHLNSFVVFNNNKNNILYSSLREIKAVVRSDNEGHISIILSHQTHAHTHSSTYIPFLSICIH